MRQYIFGAHPDHRPVMVKHHVGEDGPGNGMKAFAAHPPAALTHKLVVLAFGALIAVDLHV